VAISFHLHHVPQADMLECRLEILLIVPHLKTYTFEYAAPNKRGQYNNILANDTYLVAVMKRLYYMIFGWWISWLVCIKPILSYNPLQNFLSKFYLRRVEITPIHYILAGM
jgi:hypothetical protein